MRRISYRTAVTAFVFAGLWFAFGLFLLWTPLPGALGIRGGLFTAWLLLFFAILALCGLTLVIASINGMFPSNVRAPRRAEQLWSAPTDGAVVLPQRPRRPPRSAKSGR
jgi:hypothetical protein